MRNLFIITAIFFAIIGIVFTVLPLGTIALLPIVLALVFGILAYTKSEGSQRKIPKLIVLVSALTILVAIGKELFIKDEVIVDQKFEQEKIESKEAAQKELEELDGLE